LLRGKKRTLASIQASGERLRRSLSLVRGLKGGEVRAGNVQPK